jgi:hypothetical protein
VPVFGGRIVSLYDRAQEEEWLLQPESRVTTLPDYGQRFQDYPLFGWDEMFPNLSPCRYPLPGPFYHASFPDHGEVWSQPWRVQAADDCSLTLMVDSRVLPLSLTRTLSSCASPSGFRLDYIITNRGDEPLVALWAAHPQFTFHDGDQISLPAGITQVINARAGEAFGPPGKLFDWPIACLANGRRQRLNSCPGIQEGSCAKFYIPPEQAANHINLLRARYGTRLSLHWSARAVPYLGLWLDACCFSHQSVVTFEPANAYFDNLETAYRLNRLPVLLPGTSQCWSLKIVIQ